MVLKSQVWLRSTKGVGVDREEPWIEPWGTTILRLKGEEEGQRRKLKGDY